MFVGVLEVFHDRSLVGLLFSKYFLLKHLRASDTPVSSPSRRWRSYLSERKVQAVTWLRQDGGHSIGWRFGGR